MKPLKIALLWHYHQPYYGMEKELMLPWVRLHGVKDYWDLPEIFHEFPDVKQTINLVPSLSLQIDDYVSGKVIDKIQRLTNINANELTDENKREILRLFFLCNLDNMIKPYPRFHELFLHGQDVDKALLTLEPNDWRDIQVWYNLTWFGYSSRKRPAIKRLFTKGKYFNERDKQMVLELYLEVLDSIKKQMIMLSELGQVELSATPFYHPILPLLCDTNSAFEALPEHKIEKDIYKHPEDAEAQIVNALDYYENEIGFRPNGMWPSEGSISDEVLNIMAKSNINWVASDEAVLSATLKEKYDPMMKFFPMKFNTNEGDIAVLFRDNNLSDAIGFVYSRWDQHDAAHDFCNRLRYIRSELISKYGESCLEHAVVPVILDGENCWEFYYENGIHFQRELYKQLSVSDELKTVTFSEATAPKHCNFFPAIKHIRPGSWINGNFNIWIGHPEEQTAWKMLSKAREAVANAKDNIDNNDYEQAMNEVYIAEGSDWFWWYGDEHVAENKTDFDVMFRWHISEIYKAIGMDVPEDVNQPIGKQIDRQRIVPQRGEVNPAIDGKISDGEKWNGAGYFDAAAAMSAMHQVGELIHRIWFASGNNNIFFRCDIVHKLENGEQIEFKFIFPINFSVIISSNGVKIKADNDLNISCFNFAMDEIIEFALPKNLLLVENDFIELIIKSKTKDSEITYPQQGSLKFEF